MTLTTFNPQPAIAAICTAPGRAGIAVVRISGADAFAIADALCPGAGAMKAGEFRLRKVRAPDSSEIIDEAVVLAFRAPRSYTGEDVVEFQTHGGAMPARRVLAAALAAGASPAGAGEFTKRAFLNGRVDLSAAEAVMDLIGAESERAARSAAEQLSGALGRRVDALLDALLAVCADIEATLDFADDEANSIIEPARVPERLAALHADIRALAATWREGRLLREGALVVLSGAPNAGKSTLFNALLGACRAIVTDIPGTTRDSIEEPLVLDGIPLRLVDTAGIRETDSEIERLGVRRSEDLVSKADLNLRVIDITDAEAENMANAANAKNTIIVLNKSDLAPPSARLSAQARLHSKAIDCNRLQSKADEDVSAPSIPSTPSNSTPHTPHSTLLQIAVSAATGAGIEELKFALKTALLDGSPAFGAQSFVAVSGRHHELLRAAAAGIEAALDAWRAAAADSAAICAQTLRPAAEALAQITGRSYTDGLLDKIFSSFCIGK